jgi:hypothetical protein
VFRHFGQPSQLVSDEFGGYLSPWNSKDEFVTKAPERVIKSFADLIAGPTRELGVLSPEEIVH